MTNLVRFGVSIEKNLLTKYDKTIEKKGYVNRSEAIRDLIRSDLSLSQIEDPHTEAIGILTIVYNHDTRELTEKLNEIQHSYLKNIISSTHIHLDHHNCLEALLIRGKVKEINEIANHLGSIKNVKNSKLTITTK